MGHLVKDLTLLARPDADTAVLRLRPIDLRDITDAAAADVQRLAAGKNQTLEVAFDGPLPVQGDSLTLRQVFVNLLENAVRHTPVGGEIHRIGKHDHARAIVEVRDAGPGIAQRDLPHLFEPFYQADTARSNADHVGLGLALAAWIVHGHAGKIEVANRQGVG